MTERLIYEWLMLWGEFDRRHDLTMLRYYHLRDIFYAFNQRQFRRTRLVDLAGALWNALGDRERAGFHIFFWRRTAEDVLRESIPARDITSAERTCARIDALLTRYQTEPPPRYDCREDGWSFSFYECIGSMPKNSPEGTPEGLQLKHERIEQAMAARRAASR
jgi:hypothetical protein